MNRLLIVVVLVVVGIVGLGFYRGWFHVGSEKADGKSNVTLSVDTAKIKEDKKTVVADVQNLGSQIKGKVAGSSEKSTDGTVVSVSGDKLTMTDKDGKEQSHPLAANVSVTCDDKTCSAADLKAGMKIRVTTASADLQAAATHIEALDNNRDFKKGI